MMLANLVSITAGMPMPVPDPYDWSDNPLPPQ